MEINYKESVQFIDSTPNDEYPLRILQAYRQNCDIKYATDNEGNCNDPLYSKMNQDQDLRAKILDSVIEKLYKTENNDFKYRLLLERNELSERIEKLRTFINDDLKFNNLGFHHKTLLKTQLSVMNTYLLVLDTRIDLLNNINE